MRRTASEVIRSLEMRIARLERQAAHPSQLPPMETANYWDTQAEAKSLESEMAQKFRGTDLKVTYMPDWVGYMVTSLDGEDLVANPALTLNRMMNIMGVRGRIKQSRGWHSVTIPMGEIKLVLNVSDDEGANFSASPIKG